MWVLLSLHEYFMLRSILHDVIRDNHIDIIAIQETKKQEFSTRMVSAINHSFDVWLVQPAIGSFGGILIGCDSGKFIIEHSVIIDFLSLFLLGIELILYRV